MIPETILRIMVLIIAAPVPTIKRTVNVWRFAVFAYFLVCGGPFGIEVAVTAGGPLPTMIGFFVMPFLWSIPQVYTSVFADVFCSRPELCVLANAMTHRR